MIRFIQSALNPGVRVREIFGWAMYDFANSGYTLVVLTALYSPYFTDVIVGEGNSWGASVWTWALALSYLIVMLTATSFGQWADRHAAKRKLLMITTLGCVICTAALGWTGPGTIVMALILIVLSNTFYSWGEGFIAAFLPELAKREKMGTISGLGWGIGYLGGMLCLGICLAYIYFAKKSGQPQADAVAATMWIVAFVYGACACVTFALLKERSTPQLQSKSNKSFWKDIQKSVNALKKFPDLRQVLISTIFYQGGVAVVIVLAAIYAQTVIDMGLQEIGIMMFLLNIAAAAGAFLLGYLQDKFGHKQVLVAVLLAWAATCIVVALCNNSNKWLFWLAATSAGLCMGSSQSIGRALVGLLAPQHRLAEFFGLWTLSARLASIIGLVLVGALNWLLGLSWSIAIISLLFIAGIIVLIPLNVKRGIELARHADKKSDN